MFSLNEIIQAAQGGQGVNNLAQHFGISPEQAQAAINAVIPALSGGLQAQAQNPNGMGAIISALTQGAHHETFQNPTATASGAAVGGDVLGQVFGSPQVTTQIAQQAAAQAGLHPDLIAQMMPVIASMVMGGMFKSMQNQGMGGLLTQLTQAAAGQGGLGAVLGQVMAGAGQPAAGAPAGGGMLGGLLSSVLGGLMGGGKGGPALPGGLSQAAVQAGMDALSKMMQPGVQVAPGHQSALQDILAQAMKAQAR